MIINERIKSMRNLRNLTLLEVAEKLGVKEATMQRYESGEIKNIKHETIVQLADIFECSPIYLMGWCESPSGLSAVIEKTEHPSILSQVKKDYGENAATALSLYVQLDEIDQVRITERMTVLLEDEKYSPKTKNGASPA